MARGVAEDPEGAVFAGIGDAGRAQCQHSPFSVVDVVVADLDVEVELL